MFRKICERETLIIITLKRTKINYKDLNELNCGRFTDLGQTRGIYGEHIFGQARSKLFMVGKSVLDATNVEKQPKSAVKFNTGNL